MTLIKIEPEQKPCLSPHHNPPTLMTLDPGTYEHICPVCGKKTTFTVNGVYC